MILQNFACSALLAATMTNILLVIQRVERANSLGMAGGLG